MKILEQAGTPLLNKFVFKFPIKDGCPKDIWCNLCENDTVKCSMKGAVYRAYCVQCQMDITGDGGYVHGVDIPTYIGETSRPARERTSEHFKNVKNWSKESVLLFHWMDKHGTETTCPPFKFEIVGAYSDPLRRQLMEALLIMEQGTLNGKNEFGINEIHVLQCALSQREQEDQLRAELEKRQKDKNLLQNFVDVMSNIYNGTDYVCCFSRDNKRQQEVHINKKCLKRLKMETSTPTHVGDYRIVELIPGDDSSMDSLGIHGTSLGTPGKSETSLDIINDMAGGIKKVSSTQLSNDMDGNKITPDKVLSGSEIEQKLVGGAGELSGVFCLFV